MGAKRFNPWHSSINLRILLRPSESCRKYYATSSSTSRGARPRSPLAPRCPCAIFFVLQSREAAIGTLRPARAPESRPRRRRRPPARSTCRRRTSPRSARRCRLALRKVLPVAAGAQDAEDEEVVAPGRRSHSNTTRARDTTFRLGGDKGLTPQPPTTVVLYWYCTGAVLVLRCCCTVAVPPHPPRPSKDRRALRKAGGHPRMGGRLRCRTVACIAAVSSQIWLIGDVAGVCRHAPACAIRRPHRREAQHRGRATGCARPRPAPSREALLSLRRGGPALSGR